MCKRLHLSFVVALYVLVFFAVSPSARALITTSSLDDFSSSTGGWQIGLAGDQPVRVPLLGPDAQTGYLSHYSDASDSNGKWLMWSDNGQWEGDYLSAGVTAINLWADVDTGTSPVSMRIAFGGPGGWFYSAAQSVGAGWSSFSFALDVGNFTHTTGSGGSGVFNDTMGGVTRFEILAGSGSVGYQPTGDIVQAGTSANTILIDDIAAVPEPSTWTLLVMAGSGALLAWRKKR